MRCPRCGTLITLGDIPKGVSKKCPVCGKTIRKQDVLVPAGRRF